MTNLLATVIILVTISWVYCDDVDAGIAVQVVDDVIAKRVQLDNSGSNEIHNLQKFHTEFIHQEGENVSNEDNIISRSTIKATTAIISNVPCTPDELDSASINGILGRSLVSGVCVDSDQLDNMCDDTRIYTSSECTVFVGSWCCFVKPEAPTNNRIVVFNTMNSPSITSNEVASTVIPTTLTTDLEAGTNVFIKKMKKYVHKVYGAPAITEPAYTIASTNTSSTYQITTATTPSTTQGVYSTSTTLPTTAEVTSSATTYATAAHIPTSTNQTQDEYINSTTVATSPFTVQVTNTPEDILTIYPSQVTTTLVKTPTTETYMTVKANTTVMYPVITYPTLETTMAAYRRKFKPFMKKVNPGGMYYAPIYQNYANVGSSAYGKLPYVLHPTYYGAGPIDPMLPYTGSGSYTYTTNGQTSAGTSSAISAVYTTSATSSQTDIATTAAIISVATSGVTPATSYNVTTTYPSIYVRTCSPVTSPTVMEGLCVYSNVVDSLCSGMQNSPSKDCRSDEICCFSSPEISSSTDASTASTSYIASDVASIPTTSTTYSTTSSTHLPTAIPTTTAYSLAPTNSTIVYSTSPTPTVVETTAAGSN